MRPADECIHPAPSRQLKLADEGNRAVLARAPQRDTLLHLYAPANHASDLALLDAAGAAARPLPISHSPDAIAERFRMERAPNTATLSPMYPTIDNSPDLRLLADRPEPADRLNASVERGRSAAMSSMAVPLRSSTSPSRAGSARPVSAAATFGKRPMSSNPAAAASAAAGAGAKRPMSSSASFAGRRSAPSSANAAARRSAPSSAASKARSKASPAVTQGDVTHPFFSIGVMDAAQADRKAEKVGADTF